MSRTRVISNSQALYVGPSPANSAHTGKVKQLTRVQSISHSWSLPWEDVRQFGNRAPIDRILLETPIVNIDFTYLLTDGRNEKFLGFNIDGVDSCLKNILDKTEDEKNYFQLTVPQGSDASGNTFTANHRVYSYGNGYISNYSVSGSVGEMPTATVSVEALNISYDSGSADNNIPAIDPSTGADNTTIKYTLPTAVTNEAGQITGLRPGDISFDLAGLDGLAPGAIWNGEGAAHIQSFELQIPLSRTPQQRLNSRFAFSREIDPLIPVTLTITANKSEVGYGKLSDIIRQCSSTGADVEVTIKQCDEDDDGEVAMKYVVKDARIADQNMDTDLDSNESVSITLSGYVGAVEDTKTNVFMFGSYVEPV